MEIKEFLAAKAEMELSIKKAVHEAVSKFEESTGYSPESIWIETAEHRPISGERRYLVTSVGSDVPL